MVEAYPDTYLDELQEMLSINTGVSVSRPTIWRALKEGGFTMKKVRKILNPKEHQSSTTWMLQMTRVAAEQSALKRHEYLTRISQYTAEQLTFVDESSVDRRTTYRGRAWSIRGTKAQRKAFFVRGRRYCQFEI
jgi:hypothetical protein